MNTMYIHKGQVAQYTDIHAKNIVVQGTLKVEGKIVANHISGKGTIEAGEIHAKTISQTYVQAKTIISNEILCEKVFAETMKIRDKLTVREYIEADFVECNCLVSVQSSIKTIIAKEAINLEPKKRGILGLAFSSWLRSSLLEVKELFVKNNSKEVSDESEESDAEYET